MPRKASRFGQPAVYNATPPTLTDGDDSALAVDVNQNLKVVSAGTGSSSDQVQGTAADNAAAVGNPVRVGHVYNTSAPTYANGDIADFQADVNGNSKVTQATLLAGEDLTNNVQGTLSKPVAASTYSGLAFSAPLNDVDISVKATAGNLLSITASNINAAIRYLQVFDKATAPSSGNTPVFSWAIPAGTSTAPAIREIGRDFLGEGGHYFASGIAVGVSTTAATFTAATTTDHVTNGTYI